MTRTLDIQLTNRIAWGDGSVSTLESPEWVIYRRGRPEFTTYATRDKAIDAAFAPYAHGGYPIAYFCPDGSVLCAKCVRDEYEGNGCGDAGTVCEGDIIFEQCDSDLTCDQCSEIIAEQNWCSEHSNWDSYPVVGEDGIVTETRDACRYCNPELFAEDN